MILTRKRNEKEKNTSMSTSGYPSLAMLPGSLLIRSEDTIPAGRIILVYSLIYAQNRYPPLYLHSTLDKVSDDIQNIFFNRVKK